MPSLTIPWHGSLIGSGPIALAIVISERDSGSPGLQVLAAATPQEVFTVDGERLVGFLAQHPENLFVCERVFDLHWRLLDYVLQRQEYTSLNALWTLVRDGRWVDVSVLTRQLRQARAHEHQRRNLLEELLRSALPQQPSSPATSADSQESRMAQIGQLLAAFSQFRAEAEQLEREAQPIPPPPYVLPEKAHDDALKQLEPFLEHLRSAAAGEPAARPAEPRRKPLPARVCASLIGHGIEVFGAIALAPRRNPGLLIRRAWLDAFRLRVDEEYREASAHLHRDRVPVDFGDKRGKAEPPASPPINARDSGHDDQDDWLSSEPPPNPPVYARDCFQWSGNQIMRNQNGVPVIDRKKLRAWLKQRHQHLHDVQIEPALIPRERNGELAADPEEWGFWPGCDRLLWAWRHVMRMAQLQRIGDGDRVIHPRSWNPNLAVYRSIGVPIFQPRPGTTFVVAKVLDLRARCLAAVCLERGYVTRARAALAFHLAKENFLEIAASKLFIDQVMRQTNTSEVADDAEGEFLDLKKQDPQQYGKWLLLANALLETAPLGLSSDLLVNLLRGDYGWEFTEAEVQHYQRSLTESIAPELTLFLEDATQDLVASRLGLTSQESWQKLVPEHHPQTTGAAIRTALKESRRHPLSKLLEARRGTDLGHATPQSFASRSDWYKCRGRSLGGRVTTWAASTAVRRQEVLLSVDDVMLSVAHELVAAGCQLLAVAGSEFILEVPDRQAERERDRIGELAIRGYERVVRNVRAAVAVEITDEW